MKRIQFPLRRLGFAIVTSYLLMFFSEVVFFNEGVAIDALAKIEEGPLAILLHTLELTLWYLPTAYLLLWLIERYRVHSLAALFVAGCLFGWVVEGLIVPYVYTGLPITLFWPIVGWHAPIDVVLGWYGIGWILGQNRPKLTFATAIVAGAAWGVWTTWLWVDPAPPTPPAEFAIYASVFGACAIVAWIACYRIPLDTFKLSWVELGLLWATLAFFYIVIILSVGWLALVLLPVVVVGVWGLERNRRVEFRPNLITTFNQTIPVWQSLFLLPLPIVAIIVYTLFYRLNIELPLAEVVSPILMLGGAIIFVRCTWAMGRQPKKLSNQQAS